MANSPQLHGARIDRATQRWVITTGRALEIEAVPWLEGPIGSPDGIGTAWIADHTRRLGGPVIAAPSEGGLIPSMSDLDGALFEAAKLRPEIRDFYEHTAAWDLDVWAAWSRWAEPGGRLVNALFARRLEQLALPLDPLDVAHGMRSQVIPIVDGSGSHRGTAWQRTLARTEQTAFGGFYATTTLPDLPAQPVVRVSFPLPNGSLTVFLVPTVTQDGMLRLTSPAGSFGEAGAYLVVRPDTGNTLWARRIPLPETFDVFVNSEGQTRCDHQLHLGRPVMLRLHYRMRRHAEADA